MARQFDVRGSGERGRRSTWSTGAAAIPTCGAESTAASGKSLAAFFLEIADPAEQDLSRAAGTPGHRLFREAVRDLEVTELVARAVWDSPDDVVF
jgi:hypothetical protein